MSWIESHIVQLVYFLDFFSQIMPLILSVAIIFTFFLIQNLAKKIKRMAFYLDRIDNHLREITYFIKDYHKDKRQPLDELESKSVEGELKEIKKP